MSGHKGILGIAPVIIQHAEVRMANATVSYFDIYLLFTNGWKFVREWLQWMFGSPGGIAFYFDHILKFRALNYRAGERQCTYNQSKKYKNQRPRDLVCLG